MKFLFDLIPVLIFFVTYKMGEFFPLRAQTLATEYLSELVNGGAISLQLAPVLLASTTAIACSFVLLILIKARGKRIDPMLWMSATSMVACGGLTIYFHDVDFIKWKPTVLDWSFATALLINQRFLKKNLIRSVFERQFTLPTAYWEKVGYAYVVFFAAYGCLNLLAAFVMFQDSFGAYITFRAFVMPAIFFVFIVAQTFYMSHQNFLMQRTQSKA